MYSVANNRRVHNKHNNPRCASIGDFCWRWRWSCLLFVISLFLPESEGDVFELALVGAAVEALVGRGALQGTEVLDIRPDLDIFEVLLVDLR